LIPESSFFHWFWWINLIPQSSFFIHLKAQHSQERFIGSRTLIFAKGFVCLAKKLVWEKLQIVKSQIAFGWIARGVWKVLIWVTKGVQRNSRAQEPKLVKFVHFFGPRIWPN
jgi:hypothetical protein